LAILRVMFFFFFFFFFNGVPRRSAHKSKHNVEQYGTIAQFQLSTIFKTSQLRSCEMKTPYLQYLHRITISAVVYQSLPEINVANFNEAVWLDIVTCSLMYGGTVSFVTYVT
jgi:hypothetical protein